MVQEGREEGEKMYYPLMLDLSQFKCLVIGGGEVACRKVKSLLAYGGKVTVLSEKFAPELEELPIERISASFEEKYLESYCKVFSLVIAATSDKLCNSRIGIYCKKHHVLCNVATDEALSSFIVPSSLQRGNLVIAVSTGSNSPALAAKIRQELEERYDEDFAEYVEKLGQLRQKIKAEVTDESMRRRLLRYIVALDEAEVMQLEYKDLAYVKDLNS